MPVLKAPYPKNCALAVLIAIDQLGNAIAGGHPDATISARVGYFSKRALSTQFYWKSLEKIIDYTFYPLDGKNHCNKALQTDIDVPFRHGSDIILFFLSIIVLVACVPISIVLRIFVILIPMWRSKNP